MAAPSATPFSPSIAPFRSAKTQAVPLSSQTFQGGLYLTGRYAFGSLVGIGNMFVLTRWIGPHDYGLYVTAIGLVAFVATLARAGIDTYIVRRERAPDSDLYAMASTLVLCISIGLSLAGCALGPLLVRWYDSHEFVGPYLILLLSVPITALTGVPMAKLERDLDYRRVAGIELGGQVIGLLLSAVLAVCHAGVWAAVAGLISGQVFVLVATCTAAKLCPRWNIRFSSDETRAMLTFGLGLTAASRMWQLRTLVNPLIVGRIAGPEGVAYVAVAVRVAESLGAVRLAGGRLALATLARLQDKQKEFVTALENAVRVQVLVLGALLCAFALFGPIFVRTVFGLQWNASLSVYPCIAAGVLVHSIYNLQSSALFVLGEHWVVLRSYALHVAVLAGITFAGLSRWGISAYGWAEILACCAYLPLQAKLSRHVSFSCRGLVPWLVVFGIVLLAPLVNDHWLSAACSYIACHFR